MILPFLSVGSEKGYAILSVVPNIPALAYCLLDKRRAIGARKEKEKFL